MNAENSPGSRPSRIRGESLYEITGRLLSDFHNLLVQFEDYDDRYKYVKDEGGSIHVDFTENPFQISIHEVIGMQARTALQNKLQFSCTNRDTDAFYAVIISHSDSKDSGYDYLIATSSERQEFENDTLEAFEIAEETLNVIRGIISSRS